MIQQLPNPRVSKVTASPTVTPRTLSLISSPGPPLLKLPVELVYSILELAILHCRPGILAVVSKAVHGVVNAILYHTVVLESPEDIALFNRTIRSKPRIFFANHVRRLVVTCLRNSPEHQVLNILAACTGLQVLVFPSSHLPFTISSRVSHAHDVGPSELILQSLDMKDVCVDPPLIPNSDSLTHLRFCEPSDVWRSPSSMLASFGPLPHLSHLQLSRRANANKDNDYLFVQDIRTLLWSRTALKLLVVSIFDKRSWISPESVADSHIWNLMRDLQDTDSRVVVLVGRYGDWKKRWEVTKTSRCSQQPASF
jgi:hypothetical protein